MYKIYIYISFFFVVSCQKYRRDTAATQGSEPICDVPPEPQYGSYEINGTLIQPGNSSYKSFYIIIKCNDQYRIEGRAVITCSDGIFTSAMPTCVPKIDIVAESSDNTSLPEETRTGYCLVPPTPKNGKIVIYGSPISPEIAAYQSFYIITQCDEWYKRQGEQMVFCADGIFSAQLPSCVQSSGRVMEYVFTNETKCVMPRPPEGIQFSIQGKAQYNKGEEYNGTVIKVTCDSGYRLVGSDTLFCVSGVWSSAIPLCVRVCPVPEDISVGYYCRSSDVSELCPKHVRIGDVINPECKIGFSYEGIMPEMVCGQNGTFNHTVTCKRDTKFTECGVPAVNALVIGGYNADHGEMPWHAAIYSEMTNPFMQICGGTIITYKYIVSAAHCFFYANFVLGASLFSVAVGKIYRPWGDKHDLFAQKFEVDEIHIPLLYFGSRGNYQNDIALLKLAAEIEFNRFVRPVCLDFSEDLNKEQLQEGNLGKVAGWGFVNMLGDISPFLHAVLIPFVSMTRCVNESSFSFRPYITSDKICAGNRGTTVCKGDSGGGLVFPKTENGVTRYYLQGIVSTAPPAGHLRCNPYSAATFTHVYKQREFIKLYI